MECRGQLAVFRIHRTSDTSQQPPDACSIPRSCVQVQINAVWLFLSDPLVGGGGVSWKPDWAPSGTHFLYSTFVTGAVPGIEDRYVAEGFSRRVANAPPGTNTYAEGPRWSPDGTRFLFSQGPVGRQQLTIANASGGNWTPIADSVLAHAHVWSPDGRWIAFISDASGKQQLEKIKQCLR